MGHSSSKCPAPPVSTAPPATPSFGRAQTMIDVSQALTQTNSAGAGDNAGATGTAALQRSSSDTALNTSYQAACQKSYQQSLEWGRNEHFFKLAHTFHTNNY